MRTDMRMAYFRRAYSGNVRRALGDRAFNGGAMGGIRRASGGKG